MKHLFPVILLTVTLSLVSCNKYVTIPATVSFKVATALGDTILTESSLMEDTLQWQVGSECIVEAKEYMNTKKPFYYLVKPDVTSILSEVDTLWLKKVNTKRTHQSDPIGWVKGRVIETHFYKSRIDTTSLL